MMALRSKVARVRLTREEDRELRRRARGRGMTLSEYIRQVVIHETPARGMTDPVAEGGAS